MKSYYKLLGIFLISSHAWASTEEVEKLFKDAKEKKEGADRTSADLTVDQFKIPRDSIAVLETKKIVAARISQFETERKAEMAQKGLQSQDGAG